MLKRLIPGIVGLLLIQIGLPLWVLIGLVIFSVSLVLVIAMFKTLMTLPEETLEVKKEVPHGSFTGSDLRYMPR